MSAAHSPPPSPLIELITRVLRIGRRCPDAADDVLEVMLLVSQIQAYVGVDHGYKHARRVIARLRQPLWDDLTGEERRLLEQAGEAIKRACDLGEDELAEEEITAAQDTSPTRGALHEVLESALGRDLPPDRIDRAAEAVLNLLESRAR